MGAQRIRMVKVAPGTLPSCSAASVRGSGHQRAGAELSGKKGSCPSTVSGARPNSLPRAGASPHTRPDPRCCQTPTGTSWSFRNCPASWRGDLEAARPGDRGLHSAHDVLGSPHGVGDDLAQ